MQDLHKSLTEPLQFHTQRQVTAVATPKYCLRSLRCRETNPGNDVHAGGRTRSGCGDVAFEA